MIVLAKDLKPGQLMRPSDDGGPFKVENVVKQAPMVSVRFSRYGELLEFIEYGEYFQLEEVTMH